MQSILRWLLQHRQEEEMAAKCLRYRRNVLLEFQERIRPREEITSKSFEVSLSKGILFHREYFSGTVKEMYLGLKELGF